MFKTINFPNFYIRLQVVKEAVELKVIKNHQRVAFFRFQHNDDLLKYLRAPYLTPLPGSNGLTIPAKELANAPLLIITESKPEISENYATGYKSDNLGLHDIELIRGISNPIIGFCTGSQLLLHDVFSDKSYAPNIHNKILGKSTVDKESWVIIMQLIHDVADDYIRWRFIACHKGKIALEREGNLKVHGNSQENFQANHDTENLAESLDLKAKQQIKKQIQAELNATIKFLERHDYNRGDDITIVECGFGHHFNLEGPADVEEGFGEACGNGGDESIQEQPQEQKWSNGKGSIFMGEVPTAKTLPILIKIKKSRTPLYQNIGAFWAAFCLKRATAFIGFILIISTAFTGVNCYFQSKSKDKTAAEINNLILTKQEEETLKAANLFSFYVRTTGKESGHDPMPLLVTVEKAIKPETIATKIEWAVSNNNIQTAITLRPTDPNQKTVNHDQKNQISSAFNSSLPGSLKANCTWEGEWHNNSFRIIGTGKNVNH